MSGVRLKQGVTPGKCALTIRRLMKRAAHGYEVPSVDQGRRSLTRGGGCLSKLEALFLSNFHHSFYRKVLKVNMDKLFPDVLSDDMNNLFLEINIYNKIVFLFGMVN